MCPQLVAIWPPAVSAIWTFQPSTTCNILRSGFYLRENSTVYLNQVWSGDCAKKAREDHALVVQSIPPHIANDPTQPTSALDFTLQFSAALLTHISVLYHLPSSSKLSPACVLLASSVVPSRFHTSSNQSPNFKLDQHQGNVKASSFEYANTSNSPSSPSPSSSVFDNRSPNPNWINVKTVKPVVKLSPQFSKFSSSNPVKIPSSSSSPPRAHTAKGWSRSPRKMRAVKFGYIMVGTRFRYMFLINLLGPFALRWSRASIDIGAMDAATSTPVSTDPARCRVDVEEVIHKLNVLPAGIDTLFSFRSSLKFQADGTSSDWQRCSQLAVSGKWSHDVAIGSSACRPVEPYVATSSGRHALHTAPTPGSQVSPNWRCIITAACNCAVTAS
ncbi:hypothetical protein B0H16DRAFT_1460467 [Mycena metata]|uniref:Uncharacterized protein n=1 Tax=Mycena metata TaxID=1033252 RepID=A0AAD7IY58_9AGAR|nr:hypothetical protein B0H16DRAFT_1460467 [Mycena metata]